MPTCGVPVAGSGWERRLPLASRTIRRMKIRLLLALAVIFVIPSAAAWSVRGHRLVGALAQAELTPRAQRAVTVLLAGEPEPTLAGVSTWADDVRANDPVLGKLSAPWHYVSIHAPSCAYNEATDCPDGNCVVGAIRAQAAILADARQPLAARRQALKFVVHFVGDVHQPLHSNNREDKGGNTVQIQMPLADGTLQGSNMHTLWDKGLVNLTGLDEPAYLSRLRVLPLVVTSPPDALPPAGAEWAEAACRISAAPGFYPDSANLPADYPARWTPKIDEQLRRAGSHLAQVLNAALDH